MRNLKKILALVLALMMTVSLMVVASAASYKDYADADEISAEDETAVAVLTGMGVFKGDEDGFRPQDTITRAEVSTSVYRVLSGDVTDSKVEVWKEYTMFDDVASDAWYAGFVNYAANVKWVIGVGNNKFEPERSITRAEFTTIAMRFTNGTLDGENIFPDVSTDDWFYDYVVGSIQYGWIEGYGDGTFRPDRLITRAEVTTIVNRMLDRQADMAYVIQHRAELNQFTDLTTEHWAYYTIVEATNEHNYKKPAIGEDWTSLKK